MMRQDRFTEGAQEVLAESQNLVENARGKLQAKGLSLIVVNDITAPQDTMHVPVHRKVIVQLQSKDVIHSFFLPEFRLKQDVVPGMTIRAWVQPTQTGEFEVACAELCGLAHYRMRGFFNVVSETQFRAWLSTQAATR